MHYFRACFRYFRYFRIIQEFGSFFSLVRRDVNISFLFLMQTQNRNDWKFDVFSSAWKNIRNWILFSFDVIVSRIRKVKRFGNILQWLIFKVLSPPTVFHLPFGSAVFIPHSVRFFTGFISKLATYGVRERSHPLHPWPCNLPSFNIISFLFPPVVRSFLFYSLFFFANRQLALYSSPFSCSHAHFIAFFLFLPLLHCLSFSAHLQRRFCSVLRRRLNSRNHRNPIVRVTSSRLARVPSSGSLLSTPHLQLREFSPPKLSLFSWLPRRFFSFCRTLELWNASPSVSVSALLIVFSTKILPTTTAIFWFFQHGNSYFPMIWHKIFTSWKNFHTIQNIVLSAGKKKAFRRTTSLFFSVTLFGNSQRSERSKGGTRARYFNEDFSHDELELSLTVIKKKRYNDTFFLAKRENVVSSPRVRSPTIVAICRLVDASLSSLFFLYFFQFVFQLFVENQTRCVQPYKFITRQNFLSYIKKKKKHQKPRTYAGCEFDGWNSWYSKDSRSAPVNFTVLRIHLLSHQYRSKDSFGSKVESGRC